MSVTVRTRLAARLPRVRRSAAIGVGILLAGGLATGAAQVATAQPQPSISQVKSEVNALTSKYDKANQQYDAAAQQLDRAKSRLAEVNKEMAADKKSYETSRKKVVQIANASFEDSGQTSLAGILTTGNPSKVLNEASMIMQLAGTRNEETKQFLSSAQQLKSVQQEQKRTEEGIATLAKRRAKIKNQAKSALESKKSELDSLTAQQQQQVQAASLGGQPTSTITSVQGSGNAATAVQFDLTQAQDHCPYVYGATGPCSAGFDCSGLQMAAWAAAGVSIPRDTYEQWAALPHVSMSDLQPGDLIYYDGEGHVAMYVGSGMIVDAPQSGQDVEEIPMNSSWYASNEDGAVRP
ncbi:MAG: C40 family peptidase [Nocardiopsaceae bacterium]|nr:C40 family peptidase [Nocardiopsaceae bacterium]